MLVNIARLKARLDEDGLDGLVATTASNNLYLTGIENTSLELFPHTAQAYTVITRDDPTRLFYITSTGSLSHILNMPQRPAGVISFGQFYREEIEGSELSADEHYLMQISSIETRALSPLDGLVHAFEELHLDDKRVGVDERGLLPGYFSQLKERVSGEMLPASQVFHWIRMVKTEAEIRRIQQAAAMTDHALTAIRGIIRPGVSEYELAREFERSIVSQGGRARATLVRIGSNGSSGNARPGNRRLQMGETVRFDLASTLNGYWADIARIFCLGEPNQRMREIYHAMLIGENAALEQAHAGMTAHELYEATMHAVKSAGVPHYRRHHVGHGIGAEVYDPPLIAPSVDTALEEGMIINIETPYYEYGFAAVHVEDPFLITSDGNQLLTTFNRELTIIE